MIRDVKALLLTWGEVSKMNFAVENCVTEPVFRDRLQAGEELAYALRNFTSDALTLLAIPYGGVPVAAPIARKLHAPLDVIVSLKIPIPANPQASMGAVTPDGTRAMNRPLVEGLGLTEEEVNELVERVQIEAQKFETLYRSGSPFPDLESRTVILIEDGLSSAYTLIAAARSIRRYHPARIIAGVPIAPQRALRIVEPHVDEVISLISPDVPAFTIPSYYEHDLNLTDQQILALLEKPVLVESC